VIFDNRGVGQSDTPPPPYTVSEMASDTLMLLDRLEIAQCHLSGSSLGGAIALDVALNHPQRVRSLQLHSSWLATDQYTRFSLGLLKRFLELGGTEFYYEATLPLLFSPAFMSGSFDQLLDILSHMRANPATYEGLSGQIDANLTHDLRHRAGEITAPTLITVGELDYLLPVSASEELHQAIAGSELIVFPGAPHLVTLENPTSFNRVTLDWMLKQTG
jgi:aminoacrylate hydrolase